MYGDDRKKLYPFPLALGVIESLAKSYCKKENSLCLELYIWMIIRS
jgi:hypothetical protein